MPDSPRPVQKPLRYHLLFAAALILLGLYAFGPALHGAWLWDDDITVTANPQILAANPAGI
ncbi:MAG TPA: hypothetical protein VGL42_02975 [Opitutaceae bacterium]|jgi:hypothetical protein